MMQGSFLNETEYFDLRGNHVFTHNFKNNNFEVDTFLTPLTYAYNNTENKFPIYIGDYPALIHRQFLIEKTSV